MANTKKLTIDWQETAKTVYAIVRREADGYRLNDADGAFASAPADPYVSLTEDSVIKGRYEKSESRTVWTDGRYSVAVYKQAGGSPSPVADTIIGSGEMSIVSDTETALLADKTVDLVWDEALTKAAHNVAQSSGKQLRQLSGYQVWDGTAQAGGLNSITLDTGASVTNDIYKEGLIIIVAGTGQGEAHHIMAYNGTTKVATIDDDWHVQPDATSEFIIFGSSAHDTVTTGLSAGGGVSSITLSGTASTIDNTYRDMMIVIPSGAGAGQARRCTAYVGATKVATVEPAWITAPDSTSAYMVYPMADVASATHYTAARAAKIDNLDAAITTRPTLAQVEASTVLAKQAKLDFVEKWILNKLVESPSGTWTLYDTDDVSVLKVWTWTAATSTRSKAT